MDVPSKSAQGPRARGSARGGSDAYAGDLGCSRINWSRAKASRPWESGNLGRAVSSYWRLHHVHVHVLQDSQLTSSCTRRLIGYLCSCFQSKRLLCREVFLSRADTYGFGFRWLLGSSAKTLRHKPGPRDRCLGNKLPGFTASSNGIRPRTERRTCGQCLVGFFDARTRQYQARSEDN